MSILIKITQNITTTSHYIQLLQEVKNMAVKESRAGLNRFKMEVSSALGVNLKEGYNGDITSRDAGRVGGEMVKRMIDAYEEKLK
jgi:tRNA(Phe) wybutosine-synthesizing methylase Tyw3